MHHFNWNWHYNICVPMYFCNLRWKNKITLNGVVIVIIKLVSLCGDWERMSDFVIYYNVGDSYF